MNLQPAERLTSLPPYIFSELNALKADAVRRGIRLTSLAIGDPDKPTPPEIVRLLQEAAARPENHVYSPYEGSLAFRQAVADWFVKRFGVGIDPTNEIVALIGSKEGVAHFPWAFCNPGDKCLYPSPGYPIFSTSISLAGGIPIPVPLSLESRFLPDLNVLEKLMREHRPKFMVLNFPSNPTSAVAPRSVLESIVSLALRYNVLLLSDNAYSEIYYDEKPLSLLEIPRAKEIAIELHSFSKTYNMTGWRLGFAAGNAQLIAGLLRMKTNIDSGPLLTVQDAFTRILPHADRYSEPIRDVYRQRRSVLLAGLDKLGIEYFVPHATFFVWARVPQGRKSMDFCRTLIEKAGLVVTPGIGFGEHGEGYFRLALTVDPPEIEEALNRMGSIET